LGTSDQPGGPQAIVPPHPSGNVPRWPGAHVAGVQHVPKSVQTSLPEHVVHVIVPPQLSLIGRHEGFATFAHVSFEQQLWFPRQT